jgi:DNA-binding transcriptional MerR regulator
MKHCGGCDLDLEQSMFSARRRSPDGLQTQCRDCMSVYKASWYRRANKAELARVEFIRLLAKRGMTLADYEAMCVEQNDRCLICGQPCERGRLSVDHDHLTDRVRGLLCRGCNFGIGLLGDDPDRLQAAAAYLRRSARVLLLGE